VVATDTASHQLAEQREVVREAQALVNNLIAQLSEAKESMAAYVQLKQDTDEFSVYATTGYQPKKNEHRRADDTGSGVVGGVAHADKVDATKSSSPPPQSITKAAVKPPLTPNSS